MDLSIFLAKSLGIFLILLSTSLLLSRKNIDLIFSIYTHTEAVFLTGVLETFLGIVLVLIHNIWTIDYRIIITIVGWILLIRGLGRTFVPSKTVRMIEVFKKYRIALQIMLVFILLVGVYLTYSGFTG